MKCSGNLQLSNTPKTIFILIMVGIKHEAAYFSIKKVNFSGNKFIEVNRGRPSK